MAPCGQTAKEGAGVEGVRAIGLDDEGAAVSADNGLVDIVRDIINPGDGEGVSAVRVAVVEQQVGVGGDGGNAVGGGSAGGAIGHDEPLVSRGVGGIIDRCRRIVEAGDGDGQGGIVTDAAAGIRDPVFDGGVDAFAGGQAVKFRTRVEAPGTIGADGEGAAFAALGRNTGGQVLRWPPYRPGPRRRSL